MRVIEGTNINDIFPRVLDLIAREGVEPRDASRNGPVRVVPVPVSIVYKRPWERVLFNAQRDANPFFHLFEALWMLMGDNDVQLPAHFTPRIAAYSDDGATLHGAYGARWHVYDQLHTLAELLRTTQNTRRAVLSIWMPERDLHAQISKDLPCNVTVVFKQDPQHARTLTMTVFNRSNDALFGACGANVVHFSMLQEYVAALCGWRMGTYTHVTNDLHVYTDPFPGQRTCWRTVFPLTPATTTPYSPSSKTTRAIVHSVPLLPTPTTDDTLTTWRAECQMLLSDVRHGAHFSERQYATPFFRLVAQPMANAHAYYRANELQKARELLVFHTKDRAGHVDWLVAGLNWLDRRSSKHRRNITTTTTTTAHP